MGGRVPVTIVTGFLGAGKTTLLNRILREPHGLRICVIENEFADDVGVESLIMKEGLGTSLGDGLFEMPNGCLCCSLRDDLIVTLQRVLQHRAAFDYILVEPSGMAHPGPVAAAFFEASEEGDGDVEGEQEGAEGAEGADGEASGGGRGGGGPGGALSSASLLLDGIVAVVDAGRIAAQLDDPRPDGTVNEAAVQIACADVVLLNKADTCSSSSSSSSFPSQHVPAEGGSTHSGGAMTHQGAATRRAAAGSLEEAKMRIRALNSAAQVYECVRGDVDLRLLLNIGAFDASAAASATSSAAAPEAAGAEILSAPPDSAGCGCGGSDGSDGHHHHHHRRDAGDGHRHDASIRTVVLRCSEPLRLRAFQEWAGRLLWEGGDDAAEGEETGRVRVEGAEGSPPAAHPEPVRPIRILRGKGVLCIAAAEDGGVGEGLRTYHPRKHIFQAVCEQFDVTEATGVDSAWGSAPRGGGGGGAAPSTSVVLIGRGLDAEKLEQSLREECT